MSLSLNIEKVFAIFLGQCLFLSFSEIQYRAGFVGIVGLKQWIKIFKIFIKIFKYLSKYSKYLSKYWNIYQNILNIYQGDIRGYHSKLNIELKSLLNIFQMFVGCAVQKFFQLTLFNLPFHQSCEWSTH